MRHRIAVLGNSPINVGIVTAADLALADHQVSFAVFPDEVARVRNAVARGEIVVEGEPSRLVSGRTGIARPDMITDDFAAALESAELILIDARAADVEKRISSIAPHLEAGQHIHFNMHGYWPSLRARKIVGDPAITYSESTAPTQAGGYDDETRTVEPHVLRNGVSTAVLPAGKGRAAYGILTDVYPNLVSDESVLKTNLESLNFLGHPAIALCNNGAFDVASDKGETIEFFGPSNSRHAGVLAEALDEERRPVCDKLSVPFRRAVDQLNLLYGANGTTVREAMANGNFFNALPPLSPDCWKQWMSMDIPYAHVPFVLLGEALHVEVPLHRGIVDIFGAMFGRDFWSSGLDLADLGLDGLSAKEIRDFVQ